MKPHRSRSLGFLLATFLVLNSVTIGRASDIWATPEVEPATGPAIDSLEEPIPGRRVRALHTPPGGTSDLTGIWTTGELIRLSEDFWVIRSETGQLEVEIPVSDLREVELSVGKRGVGAIGALVGWSAMMVGLNQAGAFRSNQPADTVYFPAELIILPAMLGGALAGAALGSYVRLERWSKWPPETSQRSPTLWGSLSDEGPSLGLRVSF